MSDPSMYTIQLDSDPAAADRELPARSIVPSPTVPHSQQAALTAAAAATAWSGEQRVGNPMGSDSYRTGPPLAALRVELPVAERRLAHCPPQRVGQLMTTTVDLRASHVNHIQNHPAASQGGGDANPSQPPPPAALSSPAHRRQPKVVWLAPKSVIALTPVLSRLVWFFLGLAGSLCWVIPGVNAIASSLHRLTTPPGVWGSVLRAPDRCEPAMVSAPILAAPNGECPFTVTTDASKDAISAVLSQGEGKDFRAVSFLYRQLTAVEKNYEVHDRELLAVVYALSNWRHYLHGSRTTVVTGDWPDKFPNQPIQMCRHARWMITLAGFDLEVTHKPGVPPRVPSV